MMFESTIKSKLVSLCSIMKRRRPQGQPSAWKRGRITRREVISGFRHLPLARGKARPRYRGRRATEELKFLDVSLNDAIIGAAGATTASINLIVQGITEQTRIGRKVTVKKIGWRFRMSVPGLTAQTAPPNGDIVRVIMYLDKQCNGATAVVGNILESTDFQSFRNLTETGRFRILMDRTYDINYFAGSGITSSQDYCSVTVNDTFFYNCSVPLEFNAAAGAITEIRSNNFGVLLISEQGNAGFESSIRIRFSDG